MKAFLAYTGIIGILSMGVVLYMVIIGILSMVIIQGMIYGLEIVYG